MRLRKDKTEVTDSLEHHAVESVRGLVREKRFAEPSEPSAAYFANLLVKTNQRIDAVTSGKALSISWLARVAVPGVVAILFFFIGLHYYVPGTVSERTEVAKAVQSLQAAEFDSLVLSSSIEDVTALASANENVFDVSQDQLASYFVSQGSTSTVLESLSDQQLAEVASILESRTANL